MSYVRLINGAEAYRPMLTNVVMEIMTAYRLDPEIVEKLLKMIGEVGAIQGDIIVMGLESIDEAYLSSPMDTKELWVRLQSKDAPRLIIDLRTTPCEIIECKIADVAKKVLPSDHGYLLKPLDQSVLESLDMVLREKNEKDQKEMRGRMKEASEESKKGVVGSLKRSNKNREWLIRQITKKASSEYTTLPAPSSGLRQRRNGKGHDYARL